LALKSRKAAAAKKREAEKREIEASSRKNLAGVRVVQKNLVYVIGLNPTIRDESQLLQTLRGDQYFGQYGEIEKIVVSKAKPGGNPNQGIGVYVTFARKIDAATCIAAVDGSPNGDRVLRFVWISNFEATIISILIIIAGPSMVLLSTVRRFSATSNATTATVLSCTKQVRTLTASVVKTSPL
jgi:hypothetical protein